MLDPNYPNYPVFDPNSIEVQDLVVEATKLLIRAEELGCVLSIDQIPTCPLRSGGHQNRIEVRPKRIMAE